MWTANRSGSVRVRQDVHNAVRYALRVIVTRDVWRADATDTGFGDLLSEVFFRYRPISVSRAVGGGGEKGRQGEMSDPSDQRSLITVVDAWCFRTYFAANENALNSVSRIIKKKNTACQCCANRKLKRSICVAVANFPWGYVFPSSFVFIRVGSYVR